MIPSPEDISIKDLHYAGEISVRSFNVCSRVNILTILDLHNYLEKHGDFLKVKNCGTKSNKELLVLYKEYFHVDSTRGLNVSSQTQIAKPLDFNESIEITYAKLSVRAQNAIISYFKDQPIWHEIVKEQFIDKIFPLNELKNVGVKTAEELSAFINYCATLYESSEKQQPSCSDNSRYELKRITGISITEDSIVEKYATKEFPIIFFAREYFQELFNFDEVENTVVKSLLGLSDEMLSMDEIAKHAGLCKERIRQKKEKALQKIETSQTLQVLSDFSQYKDIVANRIIIEIPFDVLGTDLATECESSGNLFSTIVLGAILNKEYYSLTKNDRLKRPVETYSSESYNRFKRISSNYIIKNSAINKQDILSVLSVLLNLLVNRRENNVTVYLSDIVPSAITQETQTVLQKIFKIEYGLDIKDGKIILTRNTPKLVYEYAEEALEEIGKPAHIDDILAKVIEKNPNFIPSEAGMKAAMQKVKDKFIFLGRSSIFGLKKWEQISKHVKGGTIRDIVEEFLAGFDYPCHISEITKHVTQFRKTDQTSIITNLKMVVEKRFVFFKNNFVGLASINYEKKKNPKTKPSEVSLDELLFAIFSK